VKVTSQPNPLCKATIFSSDTKPVV